MAPDVILSEVKCKKRIFLGDAAVAEVTFKSSGFQGKEVPMILKHNNEKIAQKSVVLKGGLKLQKEKFVFLPEKPQELDLSISIPFQEGETTEENNIKKFTLKVVEEKMKVLLVEDGSRWEYRFLKNVLERDPNVKLNCVLYHGDKTAKGDIFLSNLPGRKELSKYDVVILGDVNSSRFTAEELKEIVLLVEEKGTALIIIAGKENSPYSFRETALEKIMPVALKKEASSGHFSKSPFMPELTLEGKDHLMLRLTLDRMKNIKHWKSLSGGYWCADVEKVKRGASVLAVHPYLNNVYGKLPIIVTQRRGSGKVLFMGMDSTWRWREGVGDKYHYRFWGQVIRWLVRSRLMGDSPYVKMTLNREQYSLGDKVYIEAYVMDKDFFPMEDGDVYVVVSSAEKEEKIRLKAHPADVGIYRGEFLPRESGRYNINAMVPSLDEEAATTELQFDVEVGSAEVESVSPDHEVLGKIARITGGKFYTTSDMDKLMEDISSALQEKRLIVEYELWDSLPFLMVFVILITMEWILRKKWGLA